jgi:hypothetical protein
MTLLSTPSVLKLNYASLVTTSMEMAKKKLEQSVQLFIIGLSPKDGIVADLTASIGNQYLYLFNFLIVHHCFI